MVNSINLTMTSKDQIATWKANRRKLVSNVVATPFDSPHSCIGLFNRRDTRLHRSRDIHAEGVW